MAAGVISYMHTFICEKCGKEYVGMFNPDHDILYPKRRLCPDCEWKETKETVKDIVSFVKRKAKRRR